MELANRTILPDGTVIVTDQGLFNLVYQEISIDDLSTDRTTDTLLYNTAIKLLDSEFKPLHLDNQERFGEQSWDQYWPTPDKYKNLNIREFLLAKCSTPEESQRIEKELELYEKNSLIPMLQHLIFLIDYWRSQNIFWGVGRGSSVSSFVLYLIGLNRMNPLEYDLSIEDFLG